MAVKLTDRMKAWIETGCHLCVATPSGVPLVTVARHPKVTADDEIAFPLSTDEFAVIEPALSENPWVAIGISGIGSIRATYQLKGQGSVSREGPSFSTIAESAKSAGVDASVVLYVKLSELYCTKPGYEAGLRLDTKPFGELEAWDKAHWTDLPKR
ncbi:MAG: hypothetical protein ACTSU5_12160 [Promethearchaeota archaeon]